MDTIVDFLRTYQVFSLFIIIALGYIAGRIKVWGFSLDVAAVIFVALLFGHLGIVMPPMLQSIGLVLFIFTVGLQAGPGFFASFKSKGRQYIILACVPVVLSLVVALAMKHLFHLEDNLFTGLYCGALSSTPGLSVAIDATNGAAITSIAYGITYPFGVLVVILIIKLIPKILRVNLKETYAKLQAHKEAVSVEHRAFRVENPKVFDKQLVEIKVREMTGATISRVQHEGKAVVASRDTVLHQGDIVRAVGTVAALERIELLVGPQVDSPLTLIQGYQVVGLLVTNRKIANQTVTHVQAAYGGNLVITRVRRSGIDLSPSPGFTLRFGDKVTVACHESDLPRLKEMFGNNARALSDTDFLPVALGIVLGVLLGKVQVSLGPSFTVSLGLTGGVLMAAILLSSLGKTGPILWTMSSSANNLLRQLGLLFFLTGVGTSAGTSLVQTLKDSGITLVLISLVITTVPMLLTLLVNALLFKINVFELLGVMAGGMTSTPGLAACESMAFDETPSVVYATVYPVALIALLLAVKIVAVA